MPEDTSRVSSEIFKTCTPGKDTLTTRALEKLIPKPNECFFFAFSVRQRHVHVKENEQTVGDVFRRRCVSA